MQVEGLCAMVGGVEELVAKAERQSGLMQVPRSTPHLSHLCSDAAATLQACRMAMQALQCLSDMGQSQVA